MMPVSHLTELEHLTLASIAEGHVSGYAVKKVLGQVRGGRWSSESGSVYRVIRRLVTEGLLEESGRAGCPNRERTEYRPTERGLQVIERWIFQPPSVTELSYLVEGMRTRAYFLRRLPEAERLAAVKSWTAASRAHLCALREEIAVLETDDPLLSVATSNLVEMGEARLRWLRRLERAVADEISARSREA